MDQRSAGRSLRPNYVRKIGIHRARKRFGQHFLVDRNVVAQLHASINVQPGDSVVEIGPGRGALTQHLASATSDLTLIELDRDFEQPLTSAYPEATYLGTDVLQVPLHTFENRRIVGNLPYNISTPLMLHLIEGSNIVDMHFMLQKEVALRLAASPGEKAWGRLSVMVQYHCKVEPLFTVAASAFKPMPKVESMFVRVQPTTTQAKSASYENFKDVVRTAFSQRRKTLANSLKRFEISWSELELDATMRADHASVDDYVAIANSLP